INIINKQMGSKAIFLIFISLFLTCMILESISKAEVQVKYHSCSTVNDCQDVHCLIAAVKCVDSLCQCPPISQLSGRKRFSLKPAETLLPCKTSSDCEDKLTCILEKFVCKNSQCQCLVE
ncbi:unnamed protein product, partial [Thlaspi arvense]